MPETTDLALRHDVAGMSDEELGRTIRIATDLAKSQLFPDAQTAHAAFAKILLGRDLGLSPTQALTGIYIVEGKPQIAAVTLAGFVRRTPGHDYRITEHTDEACSIDFIIDGEVVGTSRFTMADRERAGLRLVGSKGGPTNWAKYPRNMLFARAMSNGVKWYMPEVTGGVPVYYEGEILEGTAEPLGLATGNGDGSEPGWGDMKPEQVEQVEAVITRAEAVGHGGFDRLTTMMSLQGKPDTVIDMWIAGRNDELDEYVERMRTAEDPADAAPAIGDEEQIASEARLSSVLDQLAVAEDAGDEELAEVLSAEAARVRQALGHDVAGQPNDEPEMEL